MLGLLSLALTYSGMDYSERVVEDPEVSNQSCWIDTEYFSSSVADMVRRTGSTAPSLKASQCRLPLFRRHKHHRRLEWLGLSDNGLTGAVPQELGELIQLKVLYLSSNQLSGSIPSELGKLINLTRLDLWDNELSGAIPPELGKLTNLSELYLSENQLKGCIPEVWRNVEADDLATLVLPFCDEE